MRNWLKIAFIIFASVFTGLRVFATTYYFDATSGDDSRTPAQATNINTPWKTITKLNSFFSTLQPGDFVLFKKGETFYGTINVNKSGTSGARITIGNYGTGALPVFTSLVPVTGWTNISGNIYESLSPVSTLATARVVLINGQLQRVARYPNTTYLTIDSHLPTSGTPTTSVTDAGFNSATFTDLDNGYIVVRDIQWALEKAPITSHVLSGASGTKITFGAGLNYEAKNGWGYFVQDFATALDVAGEYYYNPSTKKLRVFSVGSPSGVQVADRDNLVTGASRSYITFDGIDFRGANSNLFTMTGTGITVQNCDVSFAGIDGIDIGGSSTVVEACNITNILNQGIEVSNASVRNCYVYNTGHMAGMNQNGAGLAAIANGGTGSVNEYNIVRNTGYIGIRAGRTSGLTKNNIIDSFCLNRNDGAGIYVQGVPNSTALYTNSRITGNIVMNGSTASAQGVASGQTNHSTYGIYGDDQMNGLIVTGNTVINMPRSAYFFHGNKNITLTDNTAFNCNESQFFLSPSGTGWNASGFVVKRNIFVAKTSTQKVVILNLNTSETITGIGTIDSNYYTRPILETVSGGIGASGNIIQTMVNFGSYLYYNLPAWKAAPFPHDHATLKATVSTTSVNNLLAIYNDTKVDKVFTLADSYKDVIGTDYSGTITLAPFESKVFITVAATVRTTPVITWPTPAAITYLTELTGTQLNASTTVPGVFSYSHSGILNAGTYTLTTTFTPSDQTLYNNATKSVTLTVNPAAATLTYTDLTKTYTGLPLTPDVATAPAGLQTINTLYGKVAATPIGAGSYPVTSGLSNQNYVASVISGTFVIEKAPATITVTSNLNQFADGNAKTVLATTNPGGLPLIITYNASPTPPTDAGTYQVIINVNHANYSGADTFSLVISSSAANIFLTDLLQTYDGSSKNVTVTSPYTYDLVYDPATHVNAGSYQVTATINDGIHTGSDVQTFIIQKKNPVLTWAQPDRIFAGAALTMTELNVTADIPGTFTFSSPVGTILPVGTQIITATFTPTDTVNYNTGTASVSISVGGNGLNYYIINGETIYVNQ